MFISILRLHKCMEEEKWVCKTKAEVRTERCIILLG